MTRSEPGPAAGSATELPGSAVRAGACALDRAAVAEAVRLLGWPGVALPETTLFGCRLVAVVALDLDAYRARQASGDGPQRDADTLAVWEWPESAGHVPRPALRLSGALFLARRGWRRALGDATRWRGFGPAAVLVPAAALADEVCRWEFALHGVGAVPATGPADTDAGQPADSAGPVVPAEPGRRVPARRRTADRWIEETLYQNALDLGLYPEPEHTRHRGAHPDTTPEENTSDVQDDDRPARDAQRRSGGRAAQH